MLMKYLNNIPKYSYPQSVHVVLLEAQSSQARREYLHELIKQSQDNGATTWLLNCHRDEGGPLAGLHSLFNHLLPQVYKSAPDLIAKYGCELVHVLPSWRRIIKVRNLSLMDLTLKDPPVRTYDANRAFRIVHGLIDFLVTWYQRCNSDAWVIVCDSFDKSGVLIQFFFTELIRRHSEQMNLTLFLAVDSQASENIASQFDSRLLRQIVKLDLPSIPIKLVIHQKMVELAQKLEDLVQKDDIDLETHIPNLIYYLLLSGQHIKALDYQIRACSLYIKRGFFQDALTYAKDALATLETYCPNNNLQRGKIVEQIFICCTTLKEPEQVLLLLQDTIEKITDSNFILSACYMMAMLYVRYLSNKDFALGKYYLELGRSELDKYDLPDELKVLWITTYQRGIALIDYREGRTDKAIQIAESSYKMLNAKLDSHQYLLEQTVQIYAIAQVLVSDGSYELALARINQVIAIDPNYPEYYNDRANLYVKMGLFNEAITDYFKAIELSPPYPEVWTNLGQCYRLMGQITDAVDAYSIALNYDPKAELALVGRAQAYEALEQSKAALADYSAALALKFEQPMLLANRSVLYYELGDLSKALEDLNQAIALLPNNPDLYYNRASIFLEMGNFDAVFQDFNAYLKLSDDAEGRAEVENQLANLRTK
jgi:tetratricopeptide (TPR) repeat protein